VSKDRSKDVAGIILAAGGSSRMKDGQQKLLLPLGDRPVLVHVIEAVLASQLQPIVVVLGSRSAEIGRTISSAFSEEQRSHLHILENRDYTKGMSSSLHVGIRDLMDENQDTIEGAMILLGDQPFVSTEMIDTLIEVEQEGGAKIVAPRYNGKRGNPVIFSTELFAELLDVVGDEGGKSVIERHRAEVRVVEMEDMGQNHDVDTWEAYQRAVTMWQEGQKEA
jgi:molybdenum cofactor cytidylyltransferase